MKDCTIRFAEEKDIQNIMNFIDTNWKKDHILAVSKPIFEYLHKSNERVNFVVAIHNDTKQIYGICGFIKSTQSYKHTSVWNVIWKKLDHAYRGLGTDMIKYIYKNTGADHMFVCGANKETLPIYERLGYKTGKLDHYYFPNNDCSPTIAVLNQRDKLSISGKVPYDLSLYHNFEEFSKEFHTEPFEDRIPYKDMWYLKTRYFDYPIYEYKVFKITYNNISLNSILVCRETSYKTAKVLRIIDFIGTDEHLAHIGNALTNLLMQHNYEYIDIYCLGIAEDILLSSGFKKLNSLDQNIIPNYFEPFLQKNIDIFYMSTVTNENFYMFKGDGDQDRPSFLQHIK